MQCIFTITQRFQLFSEHFFSYRSFGLAAALCLALLQAWGAAPIVSSKSRTVSELGGATVATSAAGSANNLLTGASDPDGGTTLTITSFTVGGVTTAVPGSYLIPNADPQFAGTNIGSITINANGSYSFTPATISSNYAYNSNYGPVPPITFTVADAQGETAQATLQLTVTPVNNGPTNTVPSFNTPEDTPLLLNQNNGVPSISLDDDAKEINGTVTVSLLISKDDLTYTGSMGTISASPGHGLTVTVRNDNNGLSDGVADTVGVTLVGPINDINAYLADPAGNPIRWTPEADRNNSCIGGPFRLTMLSFDMGNTSPAGTTGTSRRDRTTRLIGIQAVRDVTNDNLVTPHATAKTFNVLAGTGDATADNFENPNTAVTAINGAPFTNGQAVTLASGNSIIVNSNGEITFTPSAGFTGQDSFQYTAGFCPETATVTIDVGPMPVRLIDFSAGASEQGAVLSWSTAEEENSDYFQVQRSMDGILWTAAGIVRASGQSASVKRYNFTDTASMQGSAYYRLKMVDFDQSYSYSLIRKVTVAQPEFYVYPNPAGSYFQVSGLSSGQRIGVYDMSGALLLERSLTAGRVDTNGLVPGAYLVKDVASGKKVKLVIGQ